MRVRICIAKCAMDRSSFPGARYGGVGLVQGDVGEGCREQQWQGEDKDEGALELFKVWSYAGLEMRQQTKMGDLIK